MEQWHQRLRAKLAERKWNLSDLAKASGVPHSNLRQYSRGAVDQPRPEMLRRMADALGVTEQWLMFGVDAAPRPLMPFIPLVAIRPNRSEEVSMVAAPEGVPTGAWSTQADASMLPDIGPSDVLYFSARPPQPGNIVVVWIEAEQRAHIRRYAVKAVHGDGTKEYEFTPANPSHPRFSFTGESGFEVIGVVTHRLQPVAM